MSASHPLSHLQDAEAQLVASIDHATQAVNAVGSGLEAALGRLRIATLAAAARLDRASAAVRELAGDVLQAADAVAREIEAAVESNGPPPPIRRQEPAPAELALGHAEPDAPNDARPDRRSCPTWLSGGIVGAIADAAQDDAADGPRTAQDRACRFPTPEEPDARQETLGVRVARPAHPPGKNGKHKRK